MLGSDHVLQAELFQLLRLVEVILCQQGHDLETPDPAKLRLVQVWLHEEGVADFEAFAKRLFRSYLPVQCCQQVQNNTRTDPGRTFLKVPGQDLGAGREFDECESSAERIVDESDAPVCAVHRAEEVDVVWK